MREQIITVLASALFLGISALFLHISGVVDIGFIRKFEMRFPVLSEFIGIRSLKRPLALDRPRVGRVLQRSMNPVARLVLILAALAFLGLSLSLLLQALTA